MHLVRGIQKHNHTVTYAQIYFMCYITTHKIGINGLRSLSTELPYT